MKACVPLIIACCALTACQASRPHPATPKELYEQEMAAVVPGLQGQILKLRLALEQIRTPAGARRQLHLLETDLDDGVAKLEAVKAPTNIASEQAKLIAAYRSLRARFARVLSPTLKSRTTDALRVQAGKLARAPELAEIGNALQAIIAKGYDLGFPKGS